MNHYRLLNKISTGNEQINLFPLRFIINAVPFFDRSKSTLWGEGNLIPHDFLGFIVTGFQFIMIFKNRVLCGNKSGNKNSIFIAKNFPWLKRTGAGIIIFYEKCIIRDFCNDRCNRVIETMEQRISLEISFAEMCGYEAVFRFVLQSFCRDGLEPVKNLSLCIAERRYFCKKIIIDQVSP